MDDDTVILYTTDSLEDQTPNSYSYPIDITGEECLKLAMENIGMVPLPGYNLLLRTNHKNSWIDFQVSLRAQGVQTGDMIIILPSFFELPADSSTNLNSSGSSLFNSTFESDSSFYNPTTFDSGSYADSHLVPSPMPDTLLIQPSQLDPGFENPSPLIDNSFNINEAYEAVPAPQLPFEPIKIEAINMDEIGSMSDEEPDNTNSNLNSNDSINNSSGLIAESPTISNNSNAISDTLSSDFGNSPITPNNNVVNSNMVSSFDSGNFSGMNSSNELPSILMTDSGNLPLNRNRNRTVRFQSISGSGSDNENADVDLFVGDDALDLQTHAFDTFRNFEKIETPKKKEGDTQTVALATYEGFDKGGKVFTYELTLSYEHFLEEVLKNLNLEKEGRYVIVVKRANEKKIFGRDNFLDEYLLQNQDSVYLFKCLHKIKIDSSNFVPEVMNLDLSKSVDDLCADIGRHFGFEGYLTYNLYTVEEEKPRPLDGTLTVLEQTEHIKRFTFQKQYYVFSGEDLFTLDTAKIAVHDAMRQLPKDNVILNEEEAAKILLLYAIADKKRGKPIDYFKFANKANTYLPDSCRDMKLTSKMKSYLKQYKNVDPFNAIRRILNFLRHKQGFGSYNFSKSRVEIKYKGRKMRQPMIIQVAPYCLRFIRPVSNILEDRVSYSKIFSNELLGERLQIQFSTRKGRQAKYTIIGPDSEKIKFLMEQHMLIIRKIQHQRAKERANKFGGAVIDRIDEHDKVMLYTYTSFNDKEPKLLPFDLKMDGMIATQYAEQNLGIPHSENNVMIIRIYKEMFQWAKSGQMIRMLKVQNEMHAYLLRNNRPIRFHFSDGHTTKIIIDITKPIEELVEVVFHHLKITPMLGYTFFSLEDPKNPKPLDSRFTIPEVCRNWDDLLFKRRFFVISGEVLSNAFSTHSTFADCQEQFLKGGCKVTEDQIIELAVLAHYANADDASTVKNIKIIDWSKEAPQGFKVTKKFQTKLTEALKKSSPIDSFSAARSYLGKVRKIKEFGTEKFLAQYTDLTPPPSKDGKPTKGLVLEEVTLIVGPLRVIILQQLPKGEIVVIKDLSYRLIVTIESLGHRMIIRHINGDDTISGFELKVKNANVALMLINYNIKIIHDLMLAKQRKRKAEAEENAKRLAGGYIDENGIIRTRMMDFYVSKDLTKSDKLPKVWLELEKSGDEVVQILTPIMKLNPEIKWVILMRLVRKEWAWVLFENTLESVEPERLSIIYVLEAYPMIEVKFSMGMTKTMKLPIYKKVSELVDIIADKLNLNSSIGFTLFLLKGKEEIPLDGNITLPEQTPIYDHLFFKRRFFILSKFDMEDDDSLYQLFCDVRALVHAGKIEMASENALKLMYYELKVDYPIPLTKESIPKDHENYLPIGMKPKEKVSKFIKTMIDEHPVKDRREAMIEYIRLARTLPTFGTEKYDLVLVEEKKDTVERSNVFIYVGPYKIIIKDESQKKILFTIPSYKLLLGVNSTEQEFCISYHNNEDNTIIEKIHLESPNSQKISGFILSYLQCLSQILLKRIKTNDETQPTDRIELKTVYGYDIEHYVKCTYNIRWTGDIVIESACRGLGLDLEGQYSCLLRKSNEDFEWVEPDVVFGTLNPTFALYVHIYHEFMPVQVTAPVTGYERFMYLKVTRKVKKLVDEVAFKMFIDNPAGYTLYYDNLGILVPLDLMDPIPYHVIDFSKLIFKRRFMIYTKEDVISPISSAMIYPDSKERFQNGKFNISSQRMLELVGYQLIAESGDDQEVQSIEVPDDLSSYIPKDYTPKPDFKDRLKTALTARASAKTKNTKARSAFIVGTSKLKNFRCEFFNCYDFHKEASFIGSKSRKRLLKMLLDPNTMVLLDATTEKQIIYAPHKNIVSTHLIKNNVIMQITSRSGTKNQSLDRVVVASDNAAKIVATILNYRHVVLPSLDKRESIQKLPSINPQFQALVDQNFLSNDTVDMKISRQLEHPKPPIHTMSKKYNVKEAIQVGLYRITYPDKGDYMILSSKERKRYDNKYTWLSVEDNLIDADPIENSHCFIMLEKPYCQVIGENMHIKENYVDMKTIIIDLCKVLVDEFGFGNYLGYTLYEFWEGKQRPLDFLYNIPTNMENYIEVVLRRRFFLFTKEILEDENTLRASYKSVKNHVLTGNTMIISDDAAAELAIYSLYYTAQFKSDVLPIISTMNEQKLRPLLPNGIKASPNILKKFTALGTVIEPLEPLEAAMKYIILANSCIGFGMEEYPCYYSEVNNFSMTNVNALIRLCPYYISCVYDDKVQDEITRFGWNNIVEYTRDDIVTKVRYQNDSGVFISIELKSDKDCREIFSFINDMMDLFTRVDLSHLGELQEDETIQENFNFEDFDLEMVADDNFNYDDLNAIRVYQNKADFELGNVADNESIQFLEDTAKLGKIEDNEWKWRATEDGLMMKRASNLLDELSRDLDLDSLESLSAQDYTYRINLINEELKKYDFDDETKTNFLNIANSLENLRDSSLNADDFKLDEPRKLLITRQFMICRGYIEDKIVLIKSKVEEENLEDQEDINPNTLALSYNLVGASEIMENIINLMNMKDNEIEPAKRQFKVVKTTIITHSRLTTQISGIILKNKDPAILPQLINPLLLQLKNTELEVKDLIVQGKENNEDFSDINELLIDFNKLIQNLEISPALQQTNQPLKTNKYVLMTGDLREMPILVKSLEETNEALNELDENDLLSFPDLQLYKSNLSLSIHYINDRMVTLQSNPLNDVARSEMLRALNDLQETFASLQLPEDTPEVKENKRVFKVVKTTIKSRDFLRRELLKVSTINITPNNVQAIEIDLNNLINRHGGLDPELKDKIHDEDPEKVDAALKTLRDSRFLISGLSTQLQNTPASGEVIAKLQKVICDLDLKLPEIKNLGVLVNRIGNDFTYPVIVESLEANIKNALIEPPPTEDINQCPHLARFRQLQIDTAKLLNQIRSTLDSPSIRSNPDLHERISALYSRCVANYSKQIDLRRLIQSHPYDKDILNRIIELVDDLDNIASKLSAANQSILDPSLSILLSNQLNLLLKDLKSCDTALRGAPLDVFHEPPSDDLIAELDELLNGLTNYLVPQIDQSLSRGIMVPQYTELQTKVKTLLPLIPNYLEAGKHQTNEFFVMTPTMKDIILNIKSSTEAIDSLSGADQYTDRLITIFDHIMLGSDANFDISFDLLQSVVDSLADFIKLTEEYAETPGITDEAKLLLKDFSFKGTNLEQSLITTIKSQDSDQLEHSKDLILQFRGNLQQIPAPIRSSLDQKKFSLMITKISIIIRNCNYAISCIRHLPYQKKLLINSSKFTKITKDDEIEDSIPIVKEQCDEMNNHLEKLLSYSLLKEKKATLEIIQQMKDTFDPLNSYFDGMDENDLLEILVKLNDSKIFMKESSILIAPVVDDPNLISCERIRSDNVNILMRAIQAPHLTYETSNQMFEELRPQLEIVDPLLSEFKERDDVVNQKEFKKLLDSYSLDINSSISNLLTTKKVEQQKIVDDLYRETSTVLPVLMENPEYGEFQTEVTILFEILSKYTSLPLLSIRFTTPLQVKKEIYSKSNCKDLLTKTIEEIGSNTTLLSPDLSDGLANLMNSLISSPESIPRYLIHVSRLLFTSITSRNLLYAPVAVRAAISGFDDRNDMFDLLEMLIIQTARRASIQLNLIHQPFNEIEAEFAEKKENFNEQQRFWFAHSSKSLKSMDTTLLIQCPSITTFVFDYVPMHKIQQNLLLLSDSLNKTNLRSAAKNYEDWLFQSDMAAAAFFMAHMDQIASVCDDLLSESHHKVPSFLKEFVRNSANILKEIDRCVFYCTPSLSQLARLYLDFSGKYFEELKTIFSDDKTVLISSSVDSLTRIKPVILYWANNFANVDEYQYTSTIQSCGCPIVSRTADIQSSSIPPEAENSVALDIAPANGKLTTINAVIKSGIKNEIEKAEKLQKTADKANEIAFEIIARPPYGNETKISKDVGRYGKAVSAILVKLAKHHKIDYSQLPSDAVYQRSEDDFLDEIDDPKMKDYLREIRKFLKKVTTIKLHGMLRTALTGRILSRNEINEHKYPGLLDPILLINDCETRGILSIDAIQNKDKNIKVEKEKLCSSSSQEIENILFRKLQHSFLIQRLTSLKQQQVLEFPIVLSRLSQIEEAEKVRIGKEEITASYDFIVKQFDKLNERSDLKELQKNYIPDQILIQQIILAKMIRDQQTNPASPSKFAKRINKAMESLLLSAIEQLKTSTPKQTTLTELSAMLNRGFAQITLINVLIQLLQFIIIVDPDILKFAQSPEGQEAITSPLPIEQIGREQSRIAQDIQLVSKPGLLYSSLQSYMQPNTVIKIRVIISLLNILTSEEAEDFMTKNIIPTVADLLDFAVTQQNLIIQSRTDQENAPTLIDTELITKSQQMIMNLTLRTSLLYRLLTAKDAQILINPNGLAALQELKSKLALTNEEIELHTNSIVAQVLSSEISSNEIQGISADDLTSQQLMLVQLSTLIASGVVNLKLNLKASLHATLRAIQPHQIAEMSSNKDAFAAIKPLHHPYYTLDSYLLENHFQLKLHNIYAIREAIVKLEIKFPDLQKSNGIIDVSKYSDKELASLRSTAANIVSKHLASDSTVIKSIESLNEEDGETIHGILLAIERIIHLNEKKELTRFNLLENHIFDVECTRQILNESEKMKKQKEDSLFQENIDSNSEVVIEEEEEEADSNEEKSQTIINPYLKLEEIESELEISERAIFASRVLVEISVLARRRAELSSKLTHKDAASKIGEISEKRLSKLILSLKEQYESGEDLPEYLEPLTPEQLITQQLLLQSLIQQLTNDTFIQTCGIDLDVMKNFPTSQLVPLFFDSLLRQASTNPNSLRSLQNPELRSLVYVCDLAPYHVARLTLYRKMLLYIKSIITTLDLNQKYSKLSSSKQELLTNKAYDKNELVPIHELLRVSLSLKAASSEVQVAHLSEENNKQIRELNATHKLSLQLKPTNLYFQLSEANSTKASTEFGYNPFNIELDHSLIKVISNPTSIEKQELQRLQLLLQLLPFDDELHQKLIQMVRSVFSIAPTMINLPIDEVRSLLLSLTRKSIDQLTQIYNIDDLDYFPEQLNGLIQSGSQLTSLLIAISNHLPSSVTLKPVDVLVYISNLSINCISINDEKNKEEFRSNLVDFLDELKKLEAALMPLLPIDEFNYNKLDVYAGLARSLKAKDVNLSTFNFTEFNAQNVASRIIEKDEKGKDDKLIKDGAEIQKSIKHIYVSSVKIITHGVRVVGLKNFHRLVVNKITEGTTNPYDLIRSLTNLHDARSMISDCSDNLDSSLSKYIVAVRSQTESDSLAARIEFHKILNSISLAQAATLRGFEIADKTTFSFYSDAITMFSASFANIISLADLKTEGTKSTAQIRRTVRAINRTISQLSDELAYAEIEDKLLKKDKEKKAKKKAKNKEEDEEQKKESTPIEKSRLLFIKILTKAAMFVSCTGSAYASARVPETRATFVKGEEANYNEMLGELKDNSTDINKLNTDRDAAENFNLDFSSLLNTLNNFVVSSGKIEEINENEYDDDEQKVEENLDDIAYVTSKLVTLNNALSKVAISASKMTDVTPLVPDILNADRLRKNFTLPPVPNDTFNLKIQDAVDPIEKMVNDYNSKISSLVEMLNGSGDGSSQLFVNNATIAQTMNDAAGNLYLSLEQILRATTVVYNVESQSEMTNNCQLAATAFNKLLQMLRSKFLLRPDDWNNKSEKYTKITAKALEKALKEAKKAKKAGMKEQEHSSLLQRLKMTYEKLLAARGALQVIHERLYSRSRTTNENESPLAVIDREWEMRISEIGIDQASVTLDCMFRYKDNPEDVSDLDQLLSFADSLANECNNGQKHASLMLGNEEQTELNNNTELNANLVLNGIESTSQIYIEKGGEGTIEEKTLKENLKVNNNLIKSILASSQASVESKDSLEKLISNTQIKDSRGKNKNVVLSSLSAPLNSVISRTSHVKDDLLKKLQLETNVVAARIRLQHAEKVLRKI